MICGRLRIWARPSSCNARIKMLTESLAAESTSPPGEVAPPKKPLRPNPKSARPCAPTIARPASSRFGKPAPLKLKPGVEVVPAMPRSKSRSSCNPSCAPNSWTSFRLISAMRTWTMTIGGRTSNSRIAFMIDSMYRGDAATITLLLISSGITEICSKS